MNSSDVKYTQNTLNRSIIRDDFEWLRDGIVYRKKDYLLRQINRIKNYLVNSGVKKGDKITISLLQVDIDHIATIFACAELGLVLFLLDAPATEKSLPYTKVALHGPTDWYVHVGDSGRLAYGGLHGKLLDRYCGKSIDLQKLNARLSNDIQPWDIDENDSLLLSSTSGTTKPSRPIIFSHKEVVTISNRNIKVFGFDETSSVSHTRNLHHASSMLTCLIPSLMTAKYHATFSIGDVTLNEDYITDDQFITFEVTSPSHIMISNKKVLMSFLENTLPFKRTLNINMCGFALDQSFVELAKRYNIRFQSHYGSIDTAIPLLVNFVDKDSVVKKNSLGVLPDDFYQLNGTEVMCELWDEPRYIEDQLKYKDGEFFIKPRKENAGRYLMEITRGLDIDIDLFFQDTKLNYEQLRGHIRELKNDKS